MSQQLFVYGSNMCSGRLRDYDVSPDGDGHAAKLSGYHLLFNKLSTDGSGKGNVETCEGSDVWGVVYAISDADLRNLDQREVGYRRVPASVKLADNTNIDASMHEAKEPSTDPALRPFTWYKRFIVEGAREHALPKDYIVRLEEIAADEDGDRERDRRKRALVCGHHEK